MVSFTRASLLLLASVSYASLPRHNTREAPQQINLTGEGPAVTRNQGPPPRQAQVPHGRVPVGQAQIQNRFIPAQHRQQDLQRAPSFQEQHRQDPAVASQEHAVGRRSPQQQAAFPQKALSPLPTQRRQPREQSPVQQKTPSSKPTQKPQPNTEQVQRTVVAAEIARRQAEYQAYCYSIVDECLREHFNIKSIPAYREHERKVASLHADARRLYYETLKNFEEKVYFKSTPALSWKPEEGEKVMNVLSRMPVHYVEAKLKEEEEWRLRNEEIAKKEAALLTQFRAEKAAAQYVAPIETQTISHSKEEIIVECQEIIEEDKDDGTGVIEAIEIEKGLIFVTEPISSSPLNSSYDESDFQYADVYDAQLIMEALPVRTARKPGNVDHKETNAKRKRVKEFSDEEDTDFEMQSKKKAKPAPVRRPTRATRSAGKAL